MDPRHPTADHRGSRPEQLPRVVDWDKARELHADGCVYVDIDGYNAEVARWSFRASVPTFVIGLSGFSAVLQEDPAVRVACGAVMAGALWWRLYLSRHRPNIDNYVRRDP